MKHLFPATLLFLAIQQVFAQNPERFETTVSWQPVSRSTSPDGSVSRLLTCESCVASEGNPGIPALVRFFPGKKMAGAFLDEQSSVWVEVPFWELPALDTLAFLADPANSRVRIQTTEVQKNEGTQVIVPLLRKTGSRWEKLTKAAVRLQTLNPENTPAPPARTATSESSVFRRGSWIKIGITQTGVYQILVSEAVALGLDLSGRNPDDVKMYGTGGKILSEANSAFRFQDIPEMAIQVEDGGDGILNPSDRILFYAEDPHSWVWNASTAAFEYRNHIYSDTSYYFLTFSEGKGKRIASIPSNGPADLQVRNYHDRWAYAPDKVNVLSVGRTWYGDVLDFTTTKDLVFDVRGHEPDSLFRIRLGYMARSGVAYPFRTSANGLALSPDLLPSTVRLTELYAPYGAEISGIRTYRAPSPLSNLTLNVNYLKGGNPQSVGYINFVEITGARKLVWQNRDFGFRRPVSQALRLEFLMEGLPAGHRIWDVTRTTDVQNRLLSGNTFVALQDTLREYYAFNPSSAGRPPFMQRMANQDLRGLPTPVMLIVTHPAFTEQANRLASFRRASDQMDVEVVTTTQVYNEFSSGSQDITAIRNLAMHLYYKDPGLKMRYLLLFGDCSYDYKDRVPNNTNFVPTYSSPPSLLIIPSYASDDYYGILARNKGGWGNNDLMDIGVGRLPAKTPAEAKVLVDKIIHFGSATETLGEWRNRYTFVADNGDGCEHSVQADQLADRYQSLFPAALTKKIFLGAYPRVAGAGGSTVPEASEELINTINKGSLFVNYTGHGGETVWADEFLFSTDKIPGLTNYDRLSFFITATCDFGRHDYPSQTSGAESLLLHDRGGAIGILTTGRPVGSQNNFQINRAFWDFVLKPVTGAPGRMGDALREAKNNNTLRASNRGFTLLGDPSAAFSFPRKEIVVTNLADEDTIQGLDLVEIEGEVRANGVLDEAFNGRVFATFFDRPGILTIIDNDVCESKEYDIQKSFLYNGSARVTNGRFRFRFMVSRDISFLTGKGRLSLYAQDLTRKTDASGFRLNLNVGGLNPNPGTDTEGPAIRLFMNDATFRDGGLVNTGATLLAFLEDSSGINVSGLGLGHDLTATLDGEKVYNLNEFFENEEDSYRKGKVAFPLRDLSPGLHTLTVKGWDNFNNSGEATLRFEVGVAGGKETFVKNVVLYPNPTRDELYLQLDNALAGENLEVTMEIFDLPGQRLEQKTWLYDNSAARLGTRGELVWNGRKTDGSLLPGGTYICKISVKSDVRDMEYKINRKIVLIR